MLCGNRCKYCSRREDLQFHLLFDDSGAHHHMGSIKRSKFYLACVKSGDAELVCRICHVRLHRLDRSCLNTALISLSNVKSEQPHGQG